MVTEIRLYFEGDKVLRPGFASFLEEIIKRVRKRHIRWQLVSCGPRDNAYQDFVTALNTHPEAFNILLVDAEEAVTSTPWNHFKNCDNWLIPNVSNDHVHLMTQCMESWFLADIPALEGFYRTGFNSNSIPKHPNIEEVAKADVMKALDNSTIWRRNSGAYAGLVFGIVNTSFSKHEVSTKAGQLHL